MRNISFVNNTFRSVSGCGATRSGAHGCDHLCTNMSCVLSHVDPALAGEVHASGNRVFAQSSASAPASGPAPLRAPLPAPSSPAVAAIPRRLFPSPTQLQVREGILRGMTNDHGKLHLFKGIPFATPPLGALRWHPPTPRAPWTGVREAVVDSKSCYQGSNIWDKLSNFSEDCLYLNLWKPANESKDAPLNTAMIYFFGGAFDQGSAMFPLYNGEPLAAAADDIVVVVCNYRVGVFGFLGGDNLRSSTDNSTGNWGIQDQRACAQWVHDNAEALHVNTSRVLFFGESAGAASVGNHLAQKESWHLFNRAIMESGPVAAEWMALPLRDANTMLASFASKTGCASAPVLRTCLEKLSSAALWAVRPSQVCY